ncbi:hypothetical protein [Avibacterium paragallinarum]|uniref:hypothetical protein n=1 Tax=Avibacterium paragallinarum TaxID=728 RepID=UPI00061508BD|nr:hypothetical protein [Avibacterium paragallinarum]AZI13561.1 hypothetical protein EIA51_02245 [Avibacterium paragallinarum]QIR10882.1 hypothetical protein HBL79_00595 [Avibacterium paragallinarum]QJE10265.1 hypothetical protein HHJ62_08190 [Avibacterium paragallinarum]QJE12459.1 hypothetical protein HHJ61_08200 [Avibacterium paragallinarum]QJE14662.1 hypothetical protein HHJ60_08215 [Avibacterium paragallinarum]
MKLDRTIQKEILLKLAETYPHPNGENLVHYIKNKREYTGFNEYPYDYIVANLFYLQEHQLVDGFSIKYALGGTSIENFYSARLTNKGADFLLDDGGLSAILGTITIKFHEDTIKSILSTKIESSSLPKEEKSSLLNILKGLSGKALERVITKLVDLGFENADQAIPLLKIAFESLQKSVS